MNLAGGLGWGERRHRAHCVRNDAPPTPPLVATSPSGARRRDPGPRRFRRGGRWGRSRPSSGCGPPAPAPSGSMAARSISANPATPSGPGSASWPRTGAPRTSCRTCRSRRTCCWPISARIAASGVAMRREGGAAAPQEARPAGRAPARRQHAQFLGRHAAEDHPRPLAAAGAQDLILDEPTKGVDIGTRASIYAILRDIAARAWPSWWCHPISRNCWASRIASWWSAMGSWLICRRPAGRGKTYPARRPANLDDPQHHCCATSRNSAAVLGSGP